MQEGETLYSTFKSPASVEAEAARPAMLTSIRAGFDLSSVRCGVEIQLNEGIRKDTDLLERIQGLAKEREAACFQGRLELMTDAYRVDEAITPKLFRLGTVLSRALRLVHPLDMFVKQSHDLNAYCLPSRKGNRLVMCLYSGLVSSLSSQELLFVMGHEVGHAILKHGGTLGIAFDNPHFSPLEVVRVRALERSHEISCDRFGLLACQDVRVASTALFKLVSGLGERWISFDETAYSRHFDELSSMSEFVDIEDASRTHPLIPLRVKALIAFSKSEAFANAFGKTNWTVPTAEMEHGVETMLSVLDPDVSELEGKDTQEAANQFLMDGTLFVIGADGVIAPDEIAWLEARTSEKWSGEELARDLSSTEFRLKLNERLESNGAILRNKLSELGRARLLHVLCEVALTAGGLLNTEFDALNELRGWLKISVEMAESVLSTAKTESLEGADDDNAEQQDDQPAGISPVAPNDGDPWEAILQTANLPYKALVAAKATCEEIRSHNLPLGIGARALVGWAIGASRAGGVLSDAQGKKLAVAAIRICRDVQARSGVTHKARPNAPDKLVKQYGIIALFSRNETVFLGEEDRQYVVLSISRAKGTLVIAPADDLDAAQEVDPHEVRKDSQHGDWPAELTDV